MKQNTLTALLIISAILLYSMVCLVAGTSHGENCVFSSASCMYIGTGILTLLGLSFLGMFRPDYSFFIPAKRVHTLLKPPEFSI